MKITEYYHKNSDVIAFKRKEYIYGDWYEETYDERGNKLTYKDSDDLFKIKDKEVTEEEFNNFINSKQ